MQRSLCPTQSGGGLTACVYFHEISHIQRSLSFHIVPTKIPVTAEGEIRGIHRILAFCIRTRNFAFPCFPVLIFYGAPVGLWNILAAAAKVVHLLPLVPLRIQLGLAEVECLSRIRPIERSKLYVVRCFQCRPRGTVEVHLNGKSW